MFVHETHMSQHVCGQQRTIMGVSLHLPPGLRQSFFYVWLAGLEAHWGVSCHLPVITALLGLWTPAAVPYFYMGWWACALTAFPAEPFPWALCWMLKRALRLTTPVSTVNVAWILYSLPLFSNSPWSLGICDSAANSWTYYLSSGVPRALWIKISNLEVCGSRARTGFTSETCCHQFGKGPSFLVTVLFLM